MARPVRGAAFHGKMPKMHQLGIEENNGTAAGVARLRSGSSAKPSRVLRLLYAAFLAALCFAFPDRSWLVRTPTWMKRNSLNSGDGHSVAGVYDKGRWRTTWRSRDRSCSSDRTDSLLAEQSTQHMQARAATPAGLRIPSCQ